MEETGELQDWEVLPNSELSPVSTPNLVVNLRDFEGIDGDSEGMIRSDYFALDSKKRYAKTVKKEDGEDNFALDSDNSSWVDPCSESRFRDEGKRELGLKGIELGHRNSGEFWSDSGKIGDFEGKGEVGYEYDVKREVGLEGIELGHRNLGEFWSGSGKIGDFEGKGEVGYEYDVKREVGCEGVGEIEGSEIENKGCNKFWVDLGGKRMDLGEFEGFEGKSVVGDGDGVKEDLGFEGIGLKDENSIEFLSDLGGNGLVDSEFMGVEGEGELGSGGSAKIGEGSESLAVLESGNQSDGPHSAEFDEGGGGDFKDETGNGANGDGEKKRMIWWKLPLELLKFCAFRVSPVWSFSIAAAVMGFVLLGKRLYTMKRKARSIPLKVSMDDKDTSTSKVDLPSFEPLANINHFIFHRPLKGCHPRWVVDFKILLL
ncbi:uncharacterized protein LOC143864711 isoform X2 [Tasmannia lanceolata]|uniref:uncharacterized protein LOC143864711 isoform X2 n=1 Tax=Tasmannia lanceolata TaxID=3420 RepID=UPI00406322C4